MLNIGQAMLLQGLRANLRVNGVAVYASTGESIKVLIGDDPDLDDPNQIARQESAIYALVIAAAEDIANERAVTTFTEVKSGRRLKVIRVVPTSEVYSKRWKVEVQR